MTLQLGADKRLRPCHPGPELPWADVNLQEERETRSCLMLEEWMAIGMKILALGQLSPHTFTCGDLTWEPCSLCFCLLAHKMGPLAPSHSGCDGEITHLRKNLDQSAWPWNNLPAQRSFSALPFRPPTLTRVC